MFMRWLVRPSRIYQDESLAAVVVHAYREGGKQRQKQFYLSSVKSHILKNFWVRHRFWQRATEALDKIEGLKAADRARIEARIAERVPLLSAEETAEVAKVYAYHETMMAGLRDGTLRIVPE